MSYLYNVTTNKENPVQIWRRALGANCRFPAYASLSPPGQSSESWTWLLGCKVSFVTLVTLVSFLIFLVQECSPSMTDHLELHVLPPFEMPKIPLWQPGAPPAGTATGAPPLTVPENPKAYGSYETYREKGHRR